MTTTDTITIKPDEKSAKLLKTVESITGLKAPYYVTALLHQEAENSRRRRTPDITPSPTPDSDPKEAA